MDVFQEEDWPKEAEKMYERIEVLGKGSFGLVWMCQRKCKAEDEYDDEYVAVKNIEIKEEKGKVYAEREISILRELKHPNVIRLVRAFPVYQDISRLVSLQLARGPNLQRVVGKRGALGLPLCRLISRELVAAVSYLHGRGVLHRDIKPTNLILENTEIRPVEYYDYSHDNSIWSDGPEVEEIVKRNKWKIMLVDFGFARALEASEVYLDDDNDHDERQRERGSIKKKRHMRNSITLESRQPKQASQNSNPISSINDNSSKSTPGDDELGDIALIEKTANALRQTTVEPKFQGSTTRRTSHVSNLEGINESRATTSTSIPDVANNGNTAGSGRNKRESITQQKIRSMSALGTKAYAAPEIKHQLRNKTTEDLEKANAALTECVADYGMIVDAYSVGWTLRVILTGVPPNQTISKYMRKYDGQEPSADLYDEVGCCCPFLFGGGGSDDDGKIETDKKNKEKPNFRVRDTNELPKEATLFISSLTKKDPEERMSIRQAQLHPWVRGDENSGETPYVVTQGDYPSHHGDPVVPLKCAGELTRVVEKHHQ